MNDHEFWVQVRRGLLTVIDAIEQKYELPRSSREVLLWRRTETYTNGTTRHERASSQSTSVKERN